MKWLIWKEYRLNRLILIVGAVLLLLPYAHSPRCCSGGSGDVGAEPRPHGAWRCLLAAILAWLLSELTVALLGGNVIAGERADRSAEFLGYLPISRTKALASKLTLSLLTIAVIWVPNLAVLLWAFVGLREVTQVRVNFDVAQMVFFAAVTGAVLFSVSWLLSSILESPTFSVSSGVITPALIFMTIMFSCWMFNFRWRRWRGRGTWAFAWCWRPRVSWRARRTTCAGVEP